MYEIGKVYIWQNQVDEYEFLNGTECIPIEPPCWYVYNGTFIEVYGQRVEGEIEMVAFRGDLRPKNPPSGEKKVMEQFQPKPELEPA